MKVVALDCGGVLFTDGGSQVIESLVRKYGYRKDAVLKLFRSEQASLLRKGRITEDQFVLWADAQLPENYDAQLIVNEWHDSYELDPGMLDLVTELKIHYRTIVFSVNVRERVNLLEKRYDFLKYFDAHVWSFEHGATKSEDRFYEALLRAAKCPPSEIALIDDNQEVAERARALGIRPFLYAGDVRALRRGLRAAGLEVVA